MFEKTTPLGKNPHQENWCVIICIPNKNIWFKTCLPYLITTIFSMSLKSNSKEDHQFEKRVIDEQAQTSLQVL